MYKNFINGFIGPAALAILISLIFGACQAPDQNTAGNTSNSTANTAAPRQPTIVAEGAESGQNNYQTVSGESLKLTVQAPGASQADVFYRPIIASDRSVKLTTLSEQQGGSFSAGMPLPQDFNGEVWARVRYGDGEARETNRLLLVARSAEEGQNSGQENPAEQADSDESARSDRLTGGRIERAALKPGDGNIRITVNVPSFRLTLWQSGKEVAVYPVGVGQKDFPIPVGMRHAHRVILNPDWVPPDSEWVRKSNDVEPYQRIPADDPLNPLGKIKYPLGDAYLLHEAQAPSDLGNLVSHGCVRILRSDLFDMTEKVAAARGIGDAREKIAQSRNDSERRIITLEEALPVDINYDTMVVEGGVLHIYPDVYDHRTNTVENLRSELQSHGVDVSQLDEKTLKEMLDRVSSEQMFVIRLSDLKAGNALARGRTEPLITEQERKGSSKSKNSNSSSGNSQSSNRRS